MISKGNNIIFNITGNFFEDFFRCGILQRMTRLVLQSRDYHLLYSLFLTPLTIDQLERFSRNWPVALPQRRVLQRRLHRLEKEGLIRGFYYAFPGPGSSPRYYKLTRLGFQSLAKTKSIASPRKGFFSEVSPLDHSHTFELADAIVKLFVSCHQQGILVVACHPENTLPLEPGRPATSPDFTCDLFVAHQRFRFYFEYDRRTERLRSIDDPDSIEAKIRRYDTWIDKPTNGRVVFLCDDRGGPKRAQRILKVASEVTVNNQRELVYATTAKTFLSVRSPALQSVFQNHRTENVCLIPRYAISARQPQQIPAWWIARSLSLNAI